MPIQRITCVWLAFLMRESKGQARLTDREEILENHNKNQIRVVSNYTHIIHIRAMSYLYIIECALSLELILTITATVRPKVASAIELHDFCFS